MTQWKHGVYWMGWLCSSCMAGTSSGPATGMTAATVQSVTGGSTQTPLAPFVSAGPPKSFMQAQIGSGGVMAAPKLLAVAFTGDPLASQLATFATALGKTAAWAAMTSEYGVGPLTVLPPRTETYAWPAMSTGGDVLAGQPSDVETYLIGRLDGSSPPWGAPDPSTVYLLFMPSGIQVSSSGNPAVSACTTGLGWHSALTLPASQVTIAYAVVAPCPAVGALSMLDTRTVAASHELVAAVTNPHLDGYANQDANHAVWGINNDGELATSCELQKRGDALMVVRPSDLGFAIQRSWSNQSVAAGHAPCVPIPAGEVFFDAVPEIGGTVQATNAVGALVSTQGLSLSAGSNAAVQIDLFSDARIAPWQVDVSELGSQDLQLKLDQGSGNNGGALHLSVTMKPYPQMAQQIVRVRSKLGSAVNNQYFLVHR